MVDNVDEESMWHEKSHPRDLSRACSQCSLGGMYALVPFSNLFHILSIYLILGF